MYGDALGDRRYETRGGVGMNKSNNAGGGSFHAEWRGAFDSANAQLRRDNVVLTKANYKKLRDKITDLEKHFSLVVEDRNSLYDVCDDYDKHIAELDATANGLMSRCERKDKHIERLQKEIDELQQIELNLSARIVKLQDRSGGTK